eukprot:TRINITY_DN2698_c0_g1_i1.p1 TRINITY_DN2698_c0_g1~~TRINITY_DN2698_c0_g1_i1.p1  ORF type:complete len:457 (-),score=86.75 TRINITY_DN2698_c0_g1_i1:57-1427(-)
MGDPTPSAKEGVKYHYITKIEDVSASLEEIRKHSIISVDLEGINLGRKGQITLLQIGVKNNIYLFDVLELREKLFDQGMRAILQSKKQLKLFFDCRTDSDALYHQYNVELKRVHDVQVFDILFRRIKKFGGKYLRGYNNCVSAFVKNIDSRFVSLKEKISKIMTDGSDNNFWGRRPIPEEALEYAAYDVKYMFDIYDTIMTDIGNVRNLVQSLEYGSDKYVQLYRDNEIEVPRRKENAEIPTDLLPAYKSNGQLDVSCYTCSLCKVSLPATRFTNKERVLDDRKCIECWRTFRAQKESSSDESSKSDTDRRASVDEPPSPVSDTSSVSGDEGQSTSAPNTNNKQHATSVNNQQLNNGSNQQAKSYNNTYRGYNANNYGPRQGQQNYVNNNYNNQRRHQPRPAYVYVPRQPIPVAYGGPGPVYPVYVQPVAGPGFVPVYNGPYPNPYDGSGYYVYRM